MLALLLAVVAAIVLIIVKPGSGDGAREAGQVEVPNDLPGTGTSKEPEKTPSQKQKGDTPECAADQLRVTPVTDSTDYADGELPQLSLIVENVGEDACVADLGTATMQFRITSGDDEVWRSVDCQENADHRSVILDPEKPLTSEAIEWDRTRSSEESCGITRDPVDSEGDSYHLWVTVGEVESEDTAQFVLY